MEQPQTTNLAPSSITSRRRYIAAIEAKLHENCSKDEALRVLRVILGAYPGQQARDPEVYHAHMIGLLTGYPSFVVEELANPSTGVMTKHSFLPSLSDIRQAAEALLLPAYQDARRLRVELDQLEDAGKAVVTDAERERVEVALAQFRDRMKNTDQAKEEDEAAQRTKEAFRRWQDTDHEAIKGSQIYIDAMGRMSKDAAA